jgi:cytochrome c553
MVSGLKGSLALLILISINVLAGSFPKDDPPPEWAFWEPQPLKEPLPEFGLTVPGSKLTISRETHSNVHAAQDWFQDEHPTMPVAVGQGRAPDQLACTLCHLPNGVGVPDSAALAGLSSAYIIQQMEEFKSGRRECAGKEKTPCHSEMKDIAEKLSTADIQEAADY